MEVPFFSVVIPTKNRPDRLADALRSVLAQTFGDFEVVVSDNSDLEFADLTREVAERVADPRIVYVRTGGTLSMPDNWEFACTQARGQFVTILTDRSVFRRDALAVVKGHLDASGAQVVAWWCDRFGADPTGRLFRRRPVSGAARRLESSAVLRYFLHGNPKSATKYMPKLLAACCHRSVLDAIRASRVGRCFLPVSPDYTNAILILGFTRLMLLVEDALYVSCGVGNGSSFRTRGPLAARFFRDLGMTEEQCVDRVPSRACFSSAVCLNDFLRIKAALPDVFDGFDIDPVHYYVSCLYDYLKSARQGADFTADYDELLRSLATEPHDVQRAVRGHAYYTRAVAFFPGGQGDEAETENDANQDLMFDDVFAAMVWSERHPRPFAETLPLELNVSDLPWEPWWERYADSPLTRVDAV